MVKKIVVAGAGTMGSGIALAAAQNNFEVLLFDTNKKSLENGKLSIQNNLEFLLKKEKITIIESLEIQKNILYSTTVSDCIGDVVVEAIIENLAIKETLYKQLAAINNADTIFASNTSSLSITDIQKNIEMPERVCGMHFFNPANVMKLVEVVAGRHTSLQTIDTINNLCLQLNKQPVICKDSPGFIVNRVARHFYLEAMLLASKNSLAIEDIDALMENAGFKMGPFKLMDLIGIDINYAVSESIYNAFEKNIRFTPSPMQAQKITEGNLGKKTGRGFYDYSQTIVL